MAGSSGRYTGGTVPVWLDTSTDYGDLPAEGFLGASRCYLAISPKDIIDDIL